MSTEVDTPKTVNTPKTFNTPKTLNTPKLDGPIEKYKNRRSALHNYIQELNNKCKIFVGPHTRYNPPVDKPLKTYSSVKDFKRRVFPNGVPEKQYFVKQNVCKFDYKTVNKDMDKSRRFYKNISNESDCQDLEGSWDPKALNRHNKQDIGLCWTDQDSKNCGMRVTNPEILRPYSGKYDLEFSKLVAEQAESCNQQPECIFQQQSAYTFDCIPKSKEVIKDKDVIDPPESMPLSNFEAFLEEWYTTNVHGKAPKTMKLLGDGDRCKNRSDDDTILAPPPPQHGNLQYIDYRTIDPTKSANASFLLSKMGKDKFERFVSFWKKKHKMSSESYAKLLKDQIDPVERFYHQMELEQLEFDYEVSLKKEIPSSYPTVPQSVVNIVMKHMVNKSSDQRGLLAWHSTGSGKTATATGVIDAFWDDSRRIVFASSLDAIASNPDWKFHQCAKNFFPRFKEYELEIISEMFRNRGVGFFSFAKLSNRVLKAQELKKTSKSIPNNNEFIDLDNCILIIDEVHNLFRPLPTQQKQHEYLESHLIDPKKHPNMKIVILTATPGDNEEDVVKLLNIVRSPSSPVIKIPNVDKKESILEFKNSIRGLVSFFDMSNDHTRFPKVVEHAITKCPMSARQFNKYIEAYKTVSAIHKNFDKLAKQNQVYKYWAPARKYANMLFNMDKDMQLSEFSSKLPYVLKNLETAPKEKHYIYSAFYTSHGYGGHGSLAIAKILEKNGYKKLTVEEAKKLNKKNMMPPTGKRYILATMTELGGDPGGAGNNLGELLKIYNAPENKDGQIVHIMVASQGFNEGIDLKAVKHIHFFEPLITLASDKQTLGRAVRSCSHEELDKKKGEWTVYIHRYMSDKPSTTSVTFDPVEIENKIKASKEAKAELAKLKPKKGTKIKGGLQRQVDALQKVILSPGRLKALQLQIKNNKKNNDSVNIPMIEEVVYQQSRDRMKSLLVLYQSIKESAIDCRVLNTFHKQTGTNIQCSF